MSGKTARSVLFVDSVENGWARLLAPDKTAFTAPLSILPAGAKEGMEITLTCEISRDSGTSAGDIDGLLSSLGDNP